MKTYLKKLTALLLTLLLALSLAACGGTDDDVTPAWPTSPP